MSSGVVDVGVYTAWLLFTGKGVPLTVTSMDSMPLASEAVKVMVRGSFRRAGSGERFTATVGAVVSVTVTVCEAVPVLPATPDKISVRDCVTMQGSRQEVARTGGIV